MDKPKVDYHPSVLIADAADTNELLMSVYDNGYPQEIYRGAANLIGGNPQPSDKSPLDTLIREIREELCIPKDFRGRADWADESDACFIRDALVENITPFADFYIHAHHIKKGVKREYDALFSAFVAQVPQEAIMCVKINMSAGKKLLSEGLISILSKDDLKKCGPFGMAHGTPLILETYLETTLPKPDGFSAKKLDTPPRTSFDKYFAEFYYQPTWIRQ